MTVWVGVVGTLLGALLAGGFAIINGYRQQAWARENQDRALHEARDQWRREAVESRRLQIREERRELYVRLLLQADRVVGKAMATTRPRVGGVSESPDTYYENFTSTVAELQLLGPRTVFRTTQDVVYRINQLMIAPTEEVEERRLEYIDDKGELIRIMHQVLIQDFEEPSTTGTDSGRP